MVVREGRTSHLRLRALEMAKLINRAHGASVIAAWQIDELDEDWLEVFEGLKDLPRRRARQELIEKQFLAFRKSHSYRVH